MMECLTVREKSLAGHTFCRFMKGGHGRFLSRFARLYSDNPSSGREGHGKNGVSGGLFHADPGVSFRICEEHSVAAGDLPGRGKRECGRIFRQARLVALVTGGYPAQERTAATISAPCQKGPEKRGGRTERTAVGGEHRREIRGGRQQGHMSLEHTGIPGRSPLRNREPRGAPSRQSAGRRPKCIDGCSVRK